jgi:hypothetical protein
MTTISVVELLEGRKRSPGLTLQTDRKVWEALREIASEQNRPMATVLRVAVLADLRGHPLAPTIAAWEKQPTTIEEARSDPRCLVYPVKVANTEILALPHKTLRWEGWCLRGPAERSPWNAETITPPPWVATNLVPTILRALASREENTFALQTQKYRFVIDASWEEDRFVGGVISDLQTWKNSGGRAVMEHDELPRDHKSRLFNHLPILRKFLDCLAGARRS